MSKFLRHIPCQNCGSRDNRALYADGGEYCFGCKDFKNGSGEDKPQVVKMSPKTKAQLEFLSVERYSPGDIRGLHEQTRRAYRYCDHTQPDGTSYHYYQAEPGVFKLRYTARKREPCKDFQWVGSLTEPTLFGMNSFRQTADQDVYLTEGEVDAMSIWQLYQTPAVSVVNGAQAACDTLARERIQARLRGFRSVVILFDSDEAGTQSAHAVYKLLCRAKLAVSMKTLVGFKDANDFLRTITRE